MEAYNDALNTLKIDLHLFENLRFASENGDWKPSKTGDKLCPKTLLDLAALFVEQLGALMFFAGMTTQDCRKCSF